MQFNFIKILRWMTAMAAGMLLMATVARAESFPGAPDIHPELTAAIEAMQQGQGGANRPGLQKNLSLIGSVILSPFFETSDVWALGNTAYVGGFGVGSTVKIVDISDPSNPTVVSELAFPSSSPQDVKAARIDTHYFHGDMLLVGEDGFGGGFSLFDVSDPANPVRLGGLRDPAFVHNTYLYQRGNRAFVLLAIPFAEVFSGPDPFNPVISDFAIAEITDPANPVIISDWGAGGDGGFPFGFDGFPGPCDVCRGDDFAAVFNHDVWANQQGTIAYLSYWDLGLILLDISDPANPTFIGRGIEPSTFGNDEGNAHNAVPARGGNLVLVSDEDFAPGPWGFLRVFDTGDAANPVQIGAFATDAALSDTPLPSTAHNIFVRGNRAYLSWYFEGIRVVDFSQPSAPREIAAFVPEPGPPVNGFIWGVYVQGDLILASDLVGILYVLKQEAGGAASP